MMDVMPVPLHEAARERYLAYALSVVTSAHCQTFAMDSTRPPSDPFHNVSRTFTNPQVDIESVRLSSVRSWVNTIHMVTKRFTMLWFGWPKTSRCGPCW